jgi:hypothetical protein
MNLVATSLTPLMFTPLGKRVTKVAKAKVLLATGSSNQAKETKQ